MFVYVDAVESMVEVIMVVVTEYSLSPRVSDHTLRYTPITPPLPSHLCIDPGSGESEVWVSLRVYVRASVREYLHRLYGKLSK